MRRWCRGFWLSELLLSLWLIAFVGAALIGLFTYLAKTSKIANERATAELLADQLLDQAIVMGPPRWGLEDELKLGQRLTVPSVNTASPLTYQLSARELPTVPPARLGKLYSLEVVVWWAPNAEVARGVERGRGMLTRERKIYIDDWTP